MNIFTVEGDGVIYRHEDAFDDDIIIDLVRSGHIVSVFRQTVAGIQYADVDQVTYELNWLFAEKEDQ